MKYTYIHIILLSTVLSTHAADQFQEMTEENRFVSPEFNEIDTLKRNAQMCFDHPFFCLTGNPEKWLTRYVREQEVTRDGEKVTQTESDAYIDAQKQNIKKFLTNNDDRRTSFMHTMASLGLCWSFDSALFVFAILTEKTTFCGPCCAVCGLSTTCMCIACSCAYCTYAEKQYNIKTND